MSLEKLSSTPKYLLDDYVKFLRFAQWRIERTGHGILAFITNHGYLNNPTFRGMRQSLMSTFDEIYLLDLHGNTKRKERSPDGSKDENVFDIQQGVAIGIFVKRQQQREANQLATVHHADLWGERASKYKYLAEQDVRTTKWATLTPQKPFYLFEPHNTELLPEYESGWKMTSIMPISSTGVKTHRDHFVLDFDVQSLQERIEAFRNLSVSDERIAELYELQDTKWSIRQVYEITGTKATPGCRWGRCRLRRPQ
jgi:predicted helicase